MLERLLRDTPLDLFVLCSSVSALLGGVGQVDYYAANAFLDAFAHAHRLHPDTTVVSVNWDTWRDVGMAVKLPAPRELEAWRAERQRTALTPADAAAAFRSVLALGAPQTVVSAREFPPALDAVTPPRALAAADPLRPAAHPRPPLARPYVAPRTVTEERVAAFWQEVLGLEQVGIEDDFFELGGHSLLALQLIPRIRAAFDIEVPPRDFFDKRTVMAMAAYIEERVLAEVEALSEEEVARLVRGEQAVPDHRAGGFPPHPQASRTAPSWS